MRIAKENMNVWRFSEVAITSNAKDPVALVHAPEAFRVQGFGLRVEG